MATSLKHSAKSSNNTSRNFASATFAHCRKIYYLKNAAIRRELRGGEIVAGSYARHFQLFFLFYSSESVREFFILEYRYLKISQLAILERWFFWSAHLSASLSATGLQYKHRYWLRYLGLIRNSLKETMSKNVF
jgi:hypothetical protein